MCFSASVSFGAGAVLVGTGMVAERKVPSPRIRPFAAIPIIFGLQQFFEGLLWLSYSNPDLAPWQDAFIYFYLFFAQVLWPVWIPYAVWRMGPNRPRKKILSYFLWVGGALAAYMLYALYTYEVSAAVASRHIRYAIDFPDINLRRVLYFLVTVVPIFISTLKWMKLLGSMLLGSMILSYVFFAYYFVSVWCFFAAILSLFIIFVIRKNKELLGFKAL